MLFRRGLELQADVLGDHRAPRQHGEVLEGLLAVIAEARGLDGADLDARPELVDHQGRQGLGLDVLGDDDERPLRLDHGFQQRHDRLNRRNFFFHKKNIRVFHVEGLGLGVRHEVGRDVTPVELHAFHDFQFVLQGLAVVHRDDALLADALHGVGNKFPDFPLGIRRDRRHLRDFFFRRDRLRQLVEARHHGVARRVDPPPQIHGVHPRGHRLAPLGEDGPRQHRRRRRAVPRDVVRLVRHLTHELRSHVHELVLELDVLRHRHTVLRHLGRPEALVQHRVPTLGPQSHRHRVG
mmetsp:Transcript_25661/g.83178  ORF Transcript_25661/g.83178 Transcript_25661/m.83178 type:complete len:294 (+) Transcript_25661:1220-2101(+)